MGGERGWTGTCELQLGVDLANRYVGVTTDIVANLTSWYSAHIPHLLGYADTEHVVENVTIRV